jgi:hypothetical protein
MFFIEVSSGAPHWRWAAPGSTIHMSVAKTLIGGEILSAKASKFNLVR